MTVTPIDFAPILALSAQEVDVDGLNEAINTRGLELADWGLAAGTLVIAIVVAMVLRRVIAKVFRARGSDGLASDLMGRLTSYVILAFGLIYAMSALGVRVGPLLGALGIVGIALAFALRDILENFVAGLLLQIRRPFDKGDQTVTGDYEGTVSEVNARSVILHTPDGVQVVVPSAELIKTPIVNLTSTGLRRTTVEVGVAYRTDLDQAKAVIEGALDRIEAVADDPPAETRVYEFGESSINMAVRYWHHPTIATMWTVRDEVTRAIKAALDEASIEIPFPQRVLQMIDDADPDASEG